MNYEFLGGNIMCQCDPNKRTPFCGVPGCEWPETNDKTDNQFELIKNFQNLFAVSILPTPFNIDEVVTDIRITKNQNPKYPNLLATVKIIFYKLFLLKFVRIMKGRDNKPFVCMPQYKDKFDNYHDHFYPITAEIRHKMNEKILKQYHLEDIPF